MEQKENLSLDLNPNQPSLQQCFSKFKAQKRKQLKKSNFTPKPIDRQDQNFRDDLRRRFIQNAMQYIGVPYAKKRLAPDHPKYNSPIFLDCCGLVRRAVNDLSQDFGFVLGRWNQSYQFDVLGEPIPFEQMKPGDLVFYQATYYPNLKKKPRIHKMVHVQIFLGGQTGQQTLASRSARTGVGLFDSYRFVSRNYYDIIWHFKSIEPWLKGVCKSYCSQHQ